MATNKYYNPLNNAISSGSSGPWHNATNVSTSAGQWNNMTNAAMSGPFSSFPANQLVGTQSIYQRIYMGQNPLKPGEWRDFEPVSASDFLNACMRLPFPSNKDHTAYAARQLPHANATHRLLLEILFNWDIEVSDWDAIALRKRLMGI